MEKFRPERERNMDMILTTYTGTDTYMDMDKARVFIHVRVNAIVHEVTFVANGQLSPFIALKVEVTDEFAALILTHATDQINGSYFLTVTRSVLIC
jgi:hypothetical protein